MNLSSFPRVLFSNRVEASLTSLRKAYFIQSGVLAATALKVFFLLLLLLAGITRAGAEFKVPPLSGPVVDQAQMLSYQSQQRMDSLLRYVAEKGDTQLQILTVLSLDGLSIEQASIRVTDEWKLGDAKTDRGVLLMVAAQDRKVRIEVGQGLEGDLPDALAKRIIDETILPLFRSGNIEEGFLLGVFEIVKKTNPELELNSFISQPERSNSRSSKEGSGKLSIWTLLFMGLMILLFIRHPFLFLLLLSGGRGRGGGFGGGGGRGGGWSGGGGGFSGGGASGSW